MKKIYKDRIDFKIKKLKDEKENIKKKLIKKLIEKFYITVNLNFYFEQNFSQLNSLKKCIYHNNLRIYFK